MADARALINEGVTKEIEDADALIVGDGVATPVGSGNDLTLTPDGEYVIIGTGKKLTINGNIVAPFNNTGAPKVAAYNAVIDDLVRLDPSGGTFAVTLPTAVGVKNRGITAKNVTDSATAVTFATTAGQTMDGQASGAVSIAAARGNLTFISDGANWDLFGE